VRVSNWAAVTVGPVGAQQLCGQSAKRVRLEIYSPQGGLTVKPDVAPGSVTDGITVKGTPPLVWDAKDHASLPTHAFFAQSIVGTQTVMVLEVFEEI
jgi:hypothetical protein